MVSRMSCPAFRSVYLPAPPHTVAFQYYVQSLCLIGRRNTIMPQQQQQQLLSEQQQDLRAMWKFIRRQSAGLIDAWTAGETDWQTDWLSWMRLHSLSMVGEGVSFQFPFVVLYIINGFHMPGYFESITGTCYNYKQLLIVPACIESNVVAMA